MSSIIDKEFQKRLEALGTLGADEIPEEALPKFLATGFTAIDHDLLGRGGLPYGRMTEIWGAPGACKSLFLYDVIANYQRGPDPRLAVIIDTENALMPSHDPEQHLAWLKRRGVDVSPKRFRYIQTNVAEEAWNLCLDFAQSGAVGLLSVDSIGNTDAKSHLSGRRFEEDKKNKGQYKYDQPGVVAKITGSGMRSLSGLILKNHVCFVPINQIRDNLSAYSAAQYQTPGGKIFKHNRSVGLEFRNLGPIKAGDKVVGQEVKVKVDRSKISTQGMSTDENNHLKFYFEGGADFSRMIRVFDAAVDCDVLVKKGSWLMWKTPDLKWQGKDKALAELEANPQLVEQLENEVKQKKGGN